MHNFIFHTSHSGSTLLAYLLKNFCDVYTEPKWTHEIIDNHLSIKYLQKNLNQYETGIIKFPSEFCYMAPKLNGEKVFLYRDLKNHLFKFINHGYALHYADVWYETVKDNFHPKCKGVNPTNANQISALMWVSRFLWMKETENVLWINSNDFFGDYVSSLKKICDFIKIECSEEIPPIHTHVKKSGFNHSDTSISTKKGQIFPYNIKCGIIPDELCDLDDDVVKTLEWVKNNIDC